MTPLGANKYIETSASVRLSAGIGIQESWASPATDMRDLVGVLANAHKSRLSHKAYVRI